jgi:hypothetical protein
MMIKNGMVLVLCALFVPLVARSPVLGTTSVSLQDAVRNNRVEVDVRSRGGATGTTVRVYVRSKAGELRLHVAPGTVFLTSEAHVQNLTASRLKGELISERTYRPGSVMVLVDSRWHSYLVEACCLDYRKRAPQAGQRLTLAMHDQRAARVLSAPEGTQPSLWAMQLALWMDRDGVSAAEVRRRYPGRITDVDVRVAQTLLSHAERTGVASIPAGIPVDVRVHVESLFATDPAVRARAVENLGQMGGRALSAAPLVAANVLRDEAGKKLASTAVSVYADPQQTAVLIESLGIPALAPLLDALRQGPLGESGVFGELPEGIGKDRMVEWFTGRLTHPKSRVRQRAARALGSLGDSRAVEPLIAALDDEDADVREQAAAALSQITGQQLGTDQARWRAWHRENRSPD